MSKARHLLRLIRETTDCCPMHSHTNHTGPVRSEYAFEMACSSIRYGPGVTSEVGMDFANMIGVSRVCLITDQTVVTLPPVEKAVQSLEKAGITYEIYDKVRVEPTDSSFEDCIQFARNYQPDAFLAVGGGSVMDTCKAANLYTCYPEADLLDFVNAPLGKGLPVHRALKPLIAVPTTAGTGSETTGVAVFDHVPTSAKTGIANRAIRPTLGLVDPDNILTVPDRVTTYSGFDVLCHAIESYTAIPYTERGPAPTNPALRPAYQGSNPLSDVWSLHACYITAKYFKRAVKDPEDYEARKNMHLASAMAGMGFGNAGVHLCHGLSYSISGLNKTYRSKDYPEGTALIPHGLSVCITSPAVFSATAESSPDRHAEIAQILGGKAVGNEDAGLALSDILRQYMYELGVPDGLSELGFTEGQIPDLVKGALPQKRVLDIAPITIAEEPLAELYARSFKVY